MNPQSHHTSDTSLWASIQQNDEAAFSALYERYWSAIYTTAFHYLKDKDACVDVVHDIFVSIWKKRHQLEIVSFQHYLTQAARYRVYKKLESLSKGKIVYMDSLAEDGKIFAVNSGSDKIEYAELELKVSEALLKLPKRCQEIYWLSRQQNLTIAEIADLLGISKRTVENQLTHALKHLRSSLGDITLVMVMWTAGQA